VLENLNGKSPAIQSAERVAEGLALVANELGGIERTLAEALRLVQSVAMRLAANASTAALLELLLPASNMTLAAQMQNTTAGMRLVNSNMNSNMPSQDHAYKFKYALINSNTLSYWHELRQA
jgi:hypothetical protein